MVNKLWIWSGAILPPGSMPASEKNDRMGGFSSSWRIYPGRSGWIRTICVCRSGFKI